MGRRSRKKKVRSARRSRDAGADGPSCPPDPPSTPTPPTRPASSRKPRRLTLALLALGAAVAIVPAAIFLFGDGGAPRPGIPTTPPPETVALRDAPELGLEDPAEFRIPANFSAARRKFAQEALQAHAEALGAYFGKDHAAFLALAGKALSLYRQAEWLTVGLSSFHYLYVSVALEAGRPEFAAGEATRWLQAFPDAIRHHEALGRIYFRIDRHRARSHFEIFAEEYPGSWLSHWHLAQIYSSLGAKEKALAAVDRCLRRIGFVPGVYPGHPQAEKTLRVSLQVTHRFYEYGRLREIAEVLLDRDPRDAEAMMALGVAARYLGDYEKAETCLRDFLRASPGGGRNAELIRLDLAIVLLKRDRPRDAVAELVPLLMDSPHLPKAYFHLGQALVRLDRSALADAMFLRARQLGPVARELRREEELRAAGRAARADRARALAHRMNGEHRKAEAVLRSALRRIPDSAAHRVFLIEHLVESRRVAAASREIAELTRQLGAQHPDVQGWTARLLALQGDFEGAARRLEALCVEAGQLRIWGLDLSRWLLDELGRPAAARKWLGAFLELGPDPTARILLARAAFEEGETDRALEILSKLSRSTDEWRRESAAIPFARCRLRRSIDPKAIGADLAEARPTSEHRPEYHLAVAEWLEAGGDPELLRDESGAPTMARARARAAELGRLDETFREICRLDASIADAPAAARLLEAARILHEMHDRESALRYAGYAAYTRPGDPDVLRQLHAWYDRPGEIFLRAKIATELHAVDRAFPEPSVEELLRVLLDA